MLLQAFKPDLAVTDVLLLGSQALVDKLGIPKAILLVFGLLEPMSGLSHGSGSTAYAHVPTFKSTLPRKMVKSGKFVSLHHPLFHQGLTTCINMVC